MGRGQAVGAGYPAGRRCLSAWWAPPPSKRVGRAIPVRRVRFPSTSATVRTLTLATRAHQDGAERLYAGVLPHPLLACESSAHRRLGAFK